MDLSNYDTGAACERGSRFTLKNPKDGSDLDAVLVLRGIDAPTYQKELLRQRRDRVERMAKLGLDRIDIEEADAEAVELLAVATIGWENLELDGAAYEFSRANAVALYTRFRWIRNQASLHVVNIAAFLD